MIHCSCYVDSSYGKCKPEPRDFVIIGFPKCGTTSLQRYMTKKYPSVCTHRNEIIYSNRCSRIWSDRFSQCIPVIVTRDPIERIWSAYRYYSWTRSIPFEKWVANIDPINMTGTTNPIESIKYGKFIEPMLKYKPIILYLENLKCEPSFPLENERHSRKFIPKKYLQIIMGMLHE